MRTLPAGEVGAGAKMKLIVNSVMGSMMASFAEGLCLTDKAGLDADVMLQVISLGAINAPMYAVKVGRAALWRFEGF